MDRRVTGRYYLQYWEDGNLWLNYHGPEDSSLGLASRVFAISHIDHFIFVKQEQSEFSNPHQIANTYFIVPVYDELTYAPESGVLGPLSAADFEATIDTLHLSEKINFQKVK